MPRVLTRWLGRYLDVWVPGPVDGRTKRRRADAMFRLSRWREYATTKVKGKRCYWEACSVLSETRTSAGYLVRRESWGYQIQMRTGNRHSVKRRTSCPLQLRPCRWGGTEDLPGFGSGRAGVRNAVGVCFFRVGGAAAFLQNEAKLEQPKTGKRGRVVLSDWMARVESRLPPHLPRPRQRWLSEIHSKGANTGFLLLFSPKGQRVACRNVVAVARNGGKIREGGVKADRASD